MAANRARPRRRRGVSRRSARPARERAPVRACSSALNALRRRDGRARAQRPAARSASRSSASPRRRRSSRFVVAFGIAKAVANLAAGGLADRVGRKRLLVAGWLLALPVPLLIALAPSWGFIVAANVLLGVNQGLAWSMTVVMKIDLVGPRRRGLALGLNESAGYLGVARGGVRHRRARRHVRAANGRLGRRGRDRGRRPARLGLLRPRHRRARRARAASARRRRPRRIAAQRVRARHVARSRPARLLARRGSSTT